VEGREKALGDSCPDTLSTVNNAAKEEVQRLYERALKGRGKAPGELPL
jgi:hypothetical protein